MWWFLYNLFMENKDAVLALPTEIKTILMISLAITIGGGIVRRVWGLVKVMIVVAILYFGATFLGLI